MLKHVLMKIITVAIRKRRKVKVIGGNSRKAILPVMKAAPQKAEVKVIKPRVTKSSLFLDMASMNDSWNKLIPVPDRSFI